MLIIARTTAYIAYRVQWCKLAYLVLGGLNIGYTTASKRRRPI